MRLTSHFTLVKKSGHKDTYSWKYCRKRVRGEKTALFPPLMQNSHPNLTTCLVIKTIFIENYHLSVSKCCDTLERVKTMSKLPFPIILRSNFMCHDLSGFRIYDSAFSQVSTWRFYTLLNQNHLMKSLNYLSDQYEKFIIL